MSFTLPNDPRLKSDAIAEIRAALKTPDLTGRLMVRSNELFDEAYSESSPHIMYRHDGAPEFRATRPPNMHKRNLAGILREFAKAVEPDRRPFMRAFEPPAAASRMPRRYRNRSARG